MSKVVSEQYTYDHRTPLLTTTQSTLAQVFRLTCA